MEKSIADELYSEVSLPKSELGQLSVPDSKQSDSRDDPWFEDESSWNDTVEEVYNVSDLDREWRKRRSEFHTVGYREGLMAGKEASAQEGFNAGFDESVYAGFRWGLVRGVTSALTSLPDGVKEKMIKTTENRNKFGQLYELVNSLSTTDALKLFHDKMPNNKSVKPINISDHSSSAISDSDVKNLDPSLLDHYHGDLQSLISDSPALSVHFGETQKKL